jgi:hypothetical protein
MCFVKSNILMCSKVPNSMEGDGVNSRREMSMKRSSENSMARGEEKGNWAFQR